MHIERRRHMPRIRFVFMTDKHFPHQDKEALATAMNLTEDLQPDWILNGGDDIDAYDVSSFDKDPLRIENLQDELDMVREHYREMRHRCPHARIVVKIGNHDERIYKYLKSKAPGLASLRCLRIPELFGLDEIGAEFYNGRQKFELFPGVVMTHGSGMVRSKSGYTAMGQLEKRGVSGLSGHTHRLGRIWKTTQAGTVSWIEGGCLCQLNPEYGDDSSMNWQQGLVVGEIIDNKYCTFNIVEINEDKTAVFNRRLYTPTGVITP